MTAATVSLNPAAGTARPSAPSLGLLTGMEMRKSLSTRSGKAVGLLAVLLGPVGVAIGSLGGEGEAPAAAILGFTGMLTGLVLLALGVLSTAGEWTHKSVQTTYLLVPQRGRVLAAKALAMAVLGLVLASIGVGLASGALALFTADVSWFMAGRAVVTVILSGAAFAVIGAGIGALVGNSAAALTGTYLTVLGILPVVSAFKPEIAEKLDPVTSVVVLAQLGWSATPALVVAGWVVVATVLGAVTTRRRAVS